MELKALDTLAGEGFLAIRAALPGGRGSRGLRPGFEVQMEGADHHVTRANFIR